MDLDLFEDFSGSSTAASSSSSTTNLLSTLNSFVDSKKRGLEERDDEEEAKETAEERQAKLLKFGEGAHAAVPGKFFSFSLFFALTLTLLILPQVSRSLLPESTSSSSILSNRKPSIISRRASPSWSPPTLLLVRPLWLSMLLPSLFVISSVSSTPPLSRLCPIRNSVTCRRSSVMSVL